MGDRSLQSLESPVRLSSHHIRLSTMAPSASTTATVAEAKPATTYKLSGGQYKELSTTSFDKDTEEGNKGEPAAKVRNTQIVVVGKLETDACACIVPQILAHMESGSKVSSS